jgi:GON domain
MDELRPIVNVTANHVQSRLNRVIVATVVLSKLENGVVWVLWSWFFSGSSDFLFVISLLTQCFCSGYEKRRIMCIDSLRNVQSNSCSEQKRPPQKRRCSPPPNCSCRGLQKQNNIRKDGEYTLLIRGRVVSMYCASMNTVEPKEYLTLRSGNLFSLFF